MTNITVKGTSLPGSPAAGQWFFKTDAFSVNDGAECTYDGTRWLSHFQSLSSSRITGISADNTITYIGRTDGANEIFVEKCSTTYQIASTNDGSNYWTIAYYVTDDTYGSAVKIHEFDSSAQSASTLYGVDNTPNITQDPSLSGVIRTVATKTGSPGNLDLLVAARFRYIITA